MKLNTHVRRYAASALSLAAAGCLTIAGCQGEEEPSEPTDPRSSIDIQNTLDALPDAQVVDVDEMGIPTFVVGNLGRLAPGDMASAKTQASIAEALSSLAPLFRIAPDDLALRKVSTDAEGDQHLRFAQLRNGLEILGGEVIVHVRDGQIFAVNGNVRGDLQAPDEPEISKKKAVEKVKSLADELEHGEVDDKPELAYLPSDGALRLVYVVTMTGKLEDKTPVLDEVLVDAVNGDIAARLPHIHSAKNREVHNLNHGTSLPGPLSRAEGGAAVNDGVVNTNYELLGTTYDCYKDLFNRDSYDGAGAKLVSSVHYGNKFMNAYWDGSQMVYGDGDGVNASNFAKSMDVTAHELTHAVTSSTSNLQYSGQSGGLNEAMSDILGETCEWYRDNQVVSANTWKVGEDIYTPGTPGDALRYMNDPKLDGLSLDYFADYSSGVDVHYSSGIPNLAFYLLAQGGTHPRGRSNINVSGIGIAKASKIFYKADTALFTSSTNFAAAKTATEQAAAQLGYSSAEIASVTAAWQAVGVGVAAPPGGGSDLTNNTPKTGLSGAKKSKAYFTLSVPAGATGLSFKINGGSGDADLYVRFGSQPTTSTYDCRPAQSGNNETCTFNAPQAGTYQVMVYGYLAYSGLSLVGAYTPPGGGGGGGGGGSCAHNKCSTGGKLASGCDPCVTQICAQDSYCCTNQWDSTCVSEVSSICGLTCP